LMVSIHHHFMTQNHFMNHHQNTFYDSLHHQIDAVLFLADC
jgi:hypothetical protein